MNHSISHERQLKYLGQWMELYIDQLPGQVTIKPFPQWLESTIDKKVNKGKKEHIKKIKHKCVYCRRSFDEVEKTKDHIVAQSLGGYDKKENRIQACKQCNEWKSDKTLEEWLAQIRKLCKKQKPHMGYSVPELGYIRYAIDKMITHVKENAKHVSTYKPK